MRPEIELMLKCARNWPDEAADARIVELLSEQIDWAFLLRIADRHRMKPFLYWNLKEKHFEHLPATVREKLEQRFMANARANLLAMGRMIRLLAEFEEAGIPVIAFKGPLSTYHLYGTPGLREFLDLDLLVAPDDVVRTNELLISSGLRPSVLLSARQLSALVRFRNEFSFIRKGLHVDLHWKLLYQCYDLEVDHCELWDRSVKTEIEGRAVRTLGPSDFFFYLGMRAAIDCWSSIYRIIDLATAVRTMSPQEFSVALDGASRVGKLRALNVGLLVAKELVGLNLEAPPLNEQRYGKAAQNLVYQTMNRLSANPEYRPGIVMNKFVGIRALERFRDKVCLLGWLAFSPGPGDVRFLVLPKQLAFIYRAVRLIRSAAKWVATLNPKSTNPSS
jgi:hypothetical protein